MQLTDTHCHIHEIIAADASGSGDDFVRNKWHKAGVTNPDEVINAAREAGVTNLLCVGTTLSDSKLAIDLVQSRENCWATIGIHPHEAKDHDNPTVLQEFASLAAMPKVVGVGECGLDYYYEHSPKGQQRKILKFQLKLAKKHNLPLVFHVREAFEDFFAILDEFKGVRGVVHSFTADKAILDKCLERGLYIGLNGIMTFTRDEKQLEAAKAVPLASLLLETDAPFLTPSPVRGTICEPKHTRVTAEFLSALRGETLENLAEHTTQNAKNLFNLTGKTAEGVE